jgi:dihydroorotase
VSLARKKRGVAVRQALTKTQASLERIHKNYAGVAKKDGGVDACQLPVLKRKAANQSRMAQLVKKHKFFSFSQNSEPHSTKQVDSTNTTHTTP